MERSLQVQSSIFSDRLKIKTIKTADCDFIQSLVNSQGWLENIGDRNIHSTSDAVAYINRILGMGDFFYWVVRTKNANVPIGIVSFLKRNYLDHFDIGFAFLPEFQGKGYAYEATRAVLGALPKIPLLNTVLATTKAKNSGSIKLLTKLGFSLEKTLHIDNEDILIYKDFISLAATAKSPAS